jgi:YbbR domain-containing protein
MMRPRLLDSLGSLVLALVLALVIWIASTEKVAPILTADLAGGAGDGPVPIAFTGTPPGTAWYAPDRRSVALSLRGIGEGLADLDASDFEASVDLSALDPGAAQYTGDVEVRCRDAWRCLRAGVRIASFQPAAVTVSVGRAVTETRPVEVVAEEDPPPGYALIGKTPDPAEVVVTGAAQQVARVKQVTGVIAGLSDARFRRRIDDVPIEPRDEYDRLVEDVTVVPSSTDVVLHVVRRGLPKYVTPEYVGRVADGYILDAFVVEPQVVQLEGPQDLIDALDLSPIIDISGFDQDTVRVLPLRLPTGVSAINAPDGVTVTVKVAPLPDARSVDVPLATRGLRDGLEVSLKPELVRVLLNGPGPVLDTLAPEAISAVVDLTDYAAGTHSLAPFITPPADVRVRSVQPEKVEVVIRARQGTPRAGPTVTAPARAATPGR